MEINPSNMEIFANIRGVNTWWNHGIHLHKWLYKIVHADEDMEETCLAVYI